MHLSYFATFVRLSLDALLILANPTGDASCCGTMTFLSHSIPRILAWATLIDPLTTFSLIFGGCCRWASLSNFTINLCIRTDLFLPSNALTLELITSQYPPAGTLITFAQFLFVALVGLRKQLVILPPRVSRKAALKKVADTIRSTPARRILVYGSDESECRIFAKELVLLVGGNLAETVSGSDDIFNREQIKAVEHEHIKSSPSLDIEDTNHVSSILLDSSSHERSLDVFRILLQKDHLLLNRLDMVLDISDPKNLSVLHPHVSVSSLLPFRLRLKRRRIPLSRYIVQVSLFLLISLLNNAAFAYNIPMAVHIIFRSGGLVVNMLLGWLYEKRRYSDLIH